MALTEHGEHGVRGSRGGLNVKGGRARGGDAVLGRGGSVGHRGDCARVDVVGQMETATRGEGGCEGEGKGGAMDGQRKAGLPSHLYLDWGWTRKWKRTARGPGHPPSSGPGPDFGQTACRRKQTLEKEQKTAPTSPDGSRCAGPGEPPGCAQVAARPDARRHHYTQPRRGRLVILTPGQLPLIYRDAQGCGEPMKYAQVSARLGRQI